MFCEYCIVLLVNSFLLPKRIVHTARDLNVNLEPLCAYRAVQ